MCYHDNLHACKGTRRVLFFTLLAWAPSLGKIPYSINVLPTKRCSFSDTLVWSPYVYFPWCGVCSHPTKNNNTLRIQSTVWNCSSEVKRIFCVGMWQWMKNGSTTTHLKQKDCQLSGQQLVKAVQTDQKLNSGLARLWNPYFGTPMVFSLSTILRKVKPLTDTISWHYWIDWAQKSRKTASHAKEKSAVPPK